MNYTDTEATQRSDFLSAADVLAIPRLQWNAALNQPVGRVGLLGRLTYYGPWLDYYLHASLGGRRGGGPGRGVRLAVQPGNATGLISPWCKPVSRDRHDRSRVLHWRPCRWGRLATTGPNSPCGCRRRTCHGVGGIRSSNG